MTPLLSYYILHLVNNLGGRVQILTPDVKENLLSIQIYLLVIKKK